MKRTILVAFLLISLFSCKDDEVKPSVTLPTITTLTPSDVIQYKAKTGGTITKDGGATITARGVCWNTLPSPTISDNHSEDGTGTGSFESTITNLDANTLYHLRAYATNSKGTAYGKDITFTTLEHVTYIGDITLTSQTAIDNFGTNHYTRIAGKIFIEDNPNEPTITNVDALADLYTVDNDLDLRNNPLLTNIDGFQNIHFAKNVILATNASLTNLNALKNITLLNQLVVYENQNLQNIDGLAGLDTVNNIIFYYNNHVTDLKGFNNITRIGRFEFTGNNSVTTFDVLTNIETIQGIWFYSCPNLVSITSFSKLTSLNNINIDDNDALTSFPGLKNITSSNIIMLTNNDALTNLDNLSELKTLKNNLLIANNSVLTDFCGIRKALQNNYDGGFNISDNPFNPTLQEIINGNCSQ